MRTLLQLVLIVLVAFFGWHYFTRPELRQCVSVPLASLSGKAAAPAVDQAQLERFLGDLSVQFRDVAARGGTLLDALSAVETSRAGTLQERLLDEGQYLYCRSVVDRVEKAAASP